MAKIKNSNETYNISDGEHTGVIESIIIYTGKEGTKKALFKIKLDDENTTFMNVVDFDSLGKYPYSNIFNELETDDTDDLINYAVRFSVKNNKSKSNGKTYTNIRTIHLI